MENYLQEAEVWVAVGMIILFAALIWAGVPGMAVKALDDRGAKIQAELDEALRLRQEAQALLASIKVRREEAEALAQRTRALFSRERWPPVMFSALVQAHCQVHPLSAIGARSLPAAPGRRASRH